MSPKKYFENELKGELLTEDKVIIALEDFGRLAWNHGYSSGRLDFEEVFSETNYYDFLNEEDESL